METILWHPQVHLRFGEELHYFLFKFSRFTQQTAGDFQLWLENDRQLQAFCLYVTVGVYDVLLRVWLNEARVDSTT